MDMTAGLRCPGMLSRDEYHTLRRRMIFHWGKWDPQCQDVEVLAPYPLVLDEPVWRAIARDAETLAAEATAAECEILTRPELLRELGLPRPIRRALKHGHASPDTPRCIRFDFHPTTEGWRISEANTDVPGGFIEAAGLPEAMTDRFPAGRSPGDPADALARALRRRVERDALIGLVHATAYSDDRQVMLLLARRLNDLGVRTILLGPDRISWDQGIARTRAPDQPDAPTALDAIVRFFPAEWLANLSRASGWREFFSAGTLQINPPSALITQSKRFPLVWDRLETPMPAWRRLLPETLDPRRVPRGQDHRWVLKPALGRVGDGIGLRGVSTDREWRRATRDSRRWPAHWAAQRRFESAPVSTPEGERHVCLGVFVIDGTAAGIYARLARRALIDAGSQDVGVFIGAAEPATVCGVEHERARAAV
ncbi:MAG: glutathionylspermidine synthase family protein [Phycisphaerales bacterium]|nr:glutathionylspermidine synthase family protein [Phycisphaerales bacterium]